MSDQMLAGFHVPAGEGLPGVLAGVKASRAATGGSLTVIEQTLNGGPPRHTHLFEDESFYILGGRLDVTCGDDGFTSTAGSFVFLPRKVPHGFTSVDGPARLLIIATPGGLDEYFAALHTALQAQASPAEIAGVLERHGIVPS